MIYTDIATYQEHINISDCQVTVLSWEKISPYPCPIAHFCTPFPNISPQHFPQHFPPTFPPTFPPSISPQHFPPTFPHRLYRMY